MKKIRIPFWIGMVLFIVSFPLGSKMIMELFHNQQMHLQYKITAINTGEPAISSTVKFHGHQIEIEEEILSEERYFDPWDNEMTRANLLIKLDGKTIDTLKAYPIRVEEVGLNRYYGELSYLEMKNKKTDQTQFIILSKGESEVQKKQPNGDIVGWIPEEELTYRQYTLDADGTLSTDLFRFQERNALQTQLLNESIVGPHRVGYYTDMWEGYITIPIPIIYPLLTLLIGFLMVIIFHPWRKKK